MSRKTLNDLELENALEDLFGLPDDVEKSDDDLEPDEDETQFSTARLQRILEDIDDSSVQDNLPIPLSLETIDDQPNSPCQQSETHSPVLVRSESRRITRPRNIPSTPSHSGGSRPPPRDSPQPSTSGTRILRSRPDAQPVSEDVDSSSDNTDYPTDDSDADEDTWKKILWPDPRPNPKVFDEVPMTTKQSFNTKTRPVCFFEKFFTTEVFELILSQTNLYANQMNVEEWMPVDLQEIRAFIGIIIIMGYKVLPTIDLYWCSDPGFRQTDIAEIMTIKRFKKIMRCLHLNDNTQQPDRNSPEYDKLYKLRPLINIVNEACKNNAMESSSQSIDESMVLFKGRSSLKQYMPLKPIQRGYKIWCRCDSGSGYLYEFEIYTGKMANTVEEGLGAKVVKNLTRHLIENQVKNVHVTFDNFFTDYGLMEFLYENDIYATGTVRRHRVGLPNLIKGVNKKNLKLQKGQFKWRVNGNVAFVVWQDNKEVLLLSTAFHPKIDVTTIQRTQKDGSKLPIPCPLVVKQYTNRMGGVDRFDQLRTTYTVGRRSKRWWLRLFYFLLDASITNAFLMSKKCNVRLTHLEFRVALARGLISGYTNRKRRSNMPNYVTRKKVTLVNTNTRQKAIHMVADEIRFSNVGDHLPYPLESYQRCRLCSTKVNDKRTKIMCEKCALPLCIVPCFNIFHRQ